VSSGSYEHYFARRQADHHIMDTANGFSRRTGGPVYDYRRLSTGTGWQQLSSAWVREGIALADSLVWIAKWYVDA